MATDSKKAKPDDPTKVPEDPAAAEAQRLKQISDAAAAKRSTYIRIGLGIAALLIAVIIIIVIATVSGGSSDKSTEDFGSQERDDSGNGDDEPTQPTDSPDPTDPVSDSSEDSSGSGDAEESGDGGSGDGGSGDSGSGYPGSGYPGSGYPGYEEERSGEASGEDTTTNSTDGILVGNSSGVEMGHQSGEIVGPELTTVEPVTVKPVIAVGLTQPDLIESVTTAVPEPEPSFTTCKDVASADKTSGTYAIQYPEGLTDVYCDMSIEARSGWTVLMKKSDFVTSSNLTLVQYASMLGDPRPGNDHWLGNDMAAVRTLDETKGVLVLNTTQGALKAFYNKFRIGDNATQYVLSVSEYDATNSNLGDVLSRYDGKKFETYDSLDANCAIVHGFGFWWHSCNVTDTGLRELIASDPNSGPTLHVDDITSITLAFQEI